MLALPQLDQSRNTAPMIRLFSRRNAVEEINSESFSCTHDKLDIPSCQAKIEQPDQDTNGGWGYFIVERGEKTLDDGGVRTCFWIDLFLYREGK